MLLTSPAVTENLDAWVKWNEFLKTLNAKDPEVRYAQERAWRIMTIKKELSNEQ